MKYIILSDTHYGIKQNSLIWLNSQMNFIYDELIPYIKELKKKDKVAVIHCGDVFDSRSSINPLIAMKVRNVFLDLYKLSDDMFVIGGNHDYYSPNYYTVDTINMVLHQNEDFRPKIITYGLYVEPKRKEDLFIPWYDYDELEQIEKILQQNNIKRVFCHADLIHIDDEHKRIFKNVQVYSGHIHTPCENNNLHTLGSTYALTFADCNSERGFHVIDTNTGKFDFVAAKNIIKFWRFKNEEIFSIQTDKIKNDYVELYINKLNLLNKKFTDQISVITSSVKNVVVIPNDDTHVITEAIEFSNYDIQEICQQNIPEELKEKFLQISRDF